MLDLGIAAARNGKPDLAVATDGTYYLSVTGSAGTDYSLVIVRNADFDTENNDTPEAAPVLQEYVRRVKQARPYFDATPESPVEAFEAEAGKHPVFRLSEDT